MSWHRHEDVVCHGRPGAAAFRAYPRISGRAFDWRQTTVLVRGSGDVLHALQFGSANDRQPIFSHVVEAPVVLARQQERLSTPPMLDALVIDRDRTLRHRRFTMPIDLARESRAGCVAAVWGAIFPRPRPSAGWTDLGPCDAPPAATHAGSHLYVVRRRGSQLDFRGFNGMSQTWDAGWRAVAGNAWNADPVIVNGLAVTIYGVAGNGWISVVRGSRNTAPGAPWGVEMQLHGSFAPETPAVVATGPQTFVCARTTGNELLHRTLDAEGRPLGEWSPLSPGMVWSTPPTAFFWSSAGGLRARGPWLYVFARNAANELWFTRRNLFGAWTAWENLGGAETAEFAVVPRAISDLALYACGRTDNLLYTIHDARLRWA